MHTEPYYTGMACNMPGTAPLTLMADPRDMQHIPLAGRAVRYVSPSRKPVQMLGD